MASGSWAITTSNGYIKGNVSWSSTTDVSINRSTVTATMILERTNTGYTTWGTGTFNVSINGVNFSSGSKSFTLTYDSNTVMVSGTQTVYHDSDGSKSITIGWSGSSDVFTVNSGSGTATLDKIPRASTISSTAYWNAGDGLTVSISRADSSFTHTVDVFVRDSANNWVRVVSRTGIGTSVSLFTVGENTSIFNCLAQANERGTLLRVYTYQNGTQIGDYQDKAGAVYNRNASTVNVGTTDLYRYVDEDFTVNINRAISTFHHDVVWTFGGFTKAIGGVQTSVNWNPDGTEEQNIYAQIPNANIGWGTITVKTYYNGVKVRPDTSVGFEWHVRNSNPAFGTNYTYKDINTTVTTVTGNNQYIVQNKSTLQVDIPTTANASAINKATMSYYDITVNGVTKRVNYSSTATVSANFGTINANSNISLQVKAVDSRGNSTTTSKTINIVPYSDPVLTASASRLNNYEDSTTLKASGSVASLNVAGTNKNSVVALRYKYAIKGQAYGALTNFTYSGFPSYTATDVALTLPKENAYDIYVEVVDKLTTISTVKSVSAGQPILFVSSTLKSVGVGRFPTVSNSFEVQGNARIINGQVEIIPQTTSAKIGSVFTGDTTKGTIWFTQASGSNDPASIVHESSSVSADTNKGVLHICPSDDNDNVNDYVTIHGTNNPETIKLWTGGNAWFAGDVSVGGSLDMGNDPINNVTYLYGQYGAIARSTDEWLRINDGDSHSSGVYFTNSIVRTDGSLQVGASGSVFNATSTALTHNGRNVDVVNSAGNNTNGYYIRYENGIQICWASWYWSSTAGRWKTAVSYPSGFYYMYLTDTWTYPATFVASPSVTVSGDLGGAFIEEHLAYTTTGVSAICESGVFAQGGVDTSSPSLRRTAFAIGWWK